MRRTRTRLRVMVALATVVAGIAAMGAPAAAIPVLSVTPTTGLEDQHPVEVSATGLTPGAHYVLAQCGEASGETCAHDFFVDGHPVPVRNAEFVTASPNGAASVRLRVERDLHLEGNPAYDCAVDACVVALLDDDFEVVASVPISFTAEGTYQWPGPAQMTASPTTGLVEWQDIAISASGLDPDYGIVFAGSLMPLAFIDVCRVVEDPGPDDCLDGDEAQDWGSDPVFYVDVDPDGTAEGGLDVHRFLPLPSGTVDCALEACTVAVTQGDNPVTNRVPISFGPEWTPYPSAAAFLDALEDVRGGSYTAGERIDLTAALTARTTTGADALAAAAHEGASSSGTNRHLAEATRLYRAYFGRAPETGGLQYWAGRMAAGLPSVEVGRLFGGTAEFRAIYGTSSNAAVVDRAYRNTLGRAPDAAGLAYWTGRLDQGLARWKMIHGFARSPELRSREQVRTAITVLVWTLAGRAPGVAELDGSPRSLRPGAGSVRNVAVDLLASEV